MKCDKTQELLTAFLLGDLDEATRSEVQLHLEQCEGCRAQRRELELTLDLVRDALTASSSTATMPQRLTPDRRARIVSEAPARRPVRVLSWFSAAHPRLALAAAACLVMAFVIGGLMMMPVSKMGEVVGEKASADGQILPEATPVPLGKGAGGYLSGIPAPASAPASKLEAATDDDGVTVLDGVGPCGEGGGGGGGRMMRSVRGPKLAQRTVPPAVEKEVKEATDISYKADFYAAKPAVADSSRAGKMGVGGGAAPARDSSELLQRSQSEAQREIILKTDLDEADRPRAREGAAQKVEISHGGGITSTRAKGIGGADRPMGMAPAASAPPPQSPPPAPVVAPDPATPGARAEDGRRGVARKVWDEARERSLGLQEVQAEVGDAAVNGTPVQTVMIDAGGTIKSPTGGTQADGGLDSVGKREKKQAPGELASKDTSRTTVADFDDKSSSLVFPVNGRADPRAGAEQTPSARSPARNVPAADALAKNKKDVDGDGVSSPGEFRRYAYRAAADEKVGAGDGKNLRTFAGEAIADPEANRRSSEVKDRTAGVKERGSLGLAAEKTLEEEGKVAAVRPLRDASNEKKDAETPTDARSWALEAWSGTQMKVMTPKPSGAEAKDKSLDQPFSRLDDGRQKAAPASPKPTVARTPAETARWEAHGETDNRASSPKASRAANAPGPAGDAAVAASVAAQRSGVSRVAKVTEAEPAETTSLFGPSLSMVPVPEPRELPAKFRAFGVNPFVEAASQAFSTFSIDVDTASYTISRNYMLRGQRPPAEAVRTEEFVNFFDYAYAAPARETFRVYAEAAPSKFGRGMHLLKIGVKGKRLGREEQRGAVLTFLVDTSGSMDKPDRIGLIRKSLKMLLDRLSPQDQVAIVQFDSSVRLALDHTSAAEKEKITGVLDALQCSGSTHLEGGMTRAYEVAARSFKPGAENRVLILSDGVANLGTMAAEDILARVDAYRKQGIYCSVFGFGIGTFDDTMLETLANKGNGMYAFIDSEVEAKRVFVDDLAATLNTIAADVKIQVEFNPKRVAKYRQLGYENRQLKKEDFRNDAVDAGEVGSGQSVTALYEVELKDGREVLATVRLRYRRTDNNRVEEVERAVTAADLKQEFEKADARFRLAACAAEFSELLRGSPHAAGTDFADVASALRPVALELPLDSQVQELLRLVQSAGSLSLAAP